MPKGWENRLVKVSNENTGGAIGWCLEPHDLAYSKLAARREKDLAFVRELIRHDLVGQARLRELVGATEVEVLRQKLAGALAVCLRRA